MNNKQDILKNVLFVITDNFGFYEVKEDSDLTRLGLDSIDYVELVMILEEDYNLEIPDSAFEQGWRTPEQIAEYLDQKINKRS